VSEQLRPQRFREPSRGVWDRWQALRDRVVTSARSGLDRAHMGFRAPLHAAHRSLAADLDSLRHRSRQLLAVFVTDYYRRFRLVVWASALALLTAVEIAIALPLLTGSSRSTVEAVEAAAPSLVATATGDEASLSQAGAVADRGREALGKSPVGPRGPKHRAGALPFAASEEEFFEETPAESSVEAGDILSAERSYQSTGGREDRVTVKRSEPVNAGPGGVKDDSPSASPAPPPPTTTAVAQPQIPAHTSVASRQPRRTSPSALITSTTSTTRTVPLPPPPTTTTPKDDDEEKRNDRKHRGSDDDDQDDHHDKDDEDDTRTTTIRSDD
jgi:hypothetical protein